MDDHSEGEWMDLVIDGVHTEVAVSPNARQEWEGGPPPWRLTRVQLEQKLKPLAETALKNAGAKAGERWVVLFPSSNETAVQQLEGASSWTSGRISVVALLVALGIAAAIYAIQ